MPTSQSTKVLRPIFLIGLSGGGKSTVGLLLAAKLERRFVDLDAVIEEEAHMTISEIFFNEREARLSRPRRGGAAPRDRARAAGHRRRWRRAGARRQHGVHAARRQGRAA